MKKTTQFRRLLQPGRLEFLMEAHNGLSATIVAEAGFKGIWASGLSIAAALGVRDNNEASWTQVLEVVEFMSDATDIPILLDGDTGFGNFNNARRLVQKLEQRGCAAVCIEDKLFPKTNSFIAGEKQALADVDEFAGKIKSMKDAQRDPDFCVVARLEAFIAGWGLEEMLRRAEAYHAAGADALLIHSKTKTPDQVLAFGRAWQERCPLVCVPTTYYATPVEQLEQAGYNLVIWANHNCRAAITAMQNVSRTIFQQRSLVSVEDKIATVKEVFRLQRAEELAAAEDRYLPRRAEFARAIILAASQGAELGEVTRTVPKAMVRIGNTPLLHKLVSDLRAERIKEIVVVRGFAKNEVRVPGVTFVDNDAYATTAELASLQKAAEWITGEVVLTFGDILFRRYILSNLLADPHDIVVVVDANWQPRPPVGQMDYVITNRPFSLKYSEDDVMLEAVGADLPKARITGEWIGLIKTTATGSQRLQAALAELAKRPDFNQLRFDALFRHLLAQSTPIKVHFITGHWLDVDNAETLLEAQNF
ncbi:MAG TPA: phosphoenolpyruvate mutase [Verrucomicrobiota bacterium]|nr:phosphoenolpyruvate mutase [Verrucomicrobiota bacterium]HNT15394.1 phosphoenolpyruvate mutase [Verrucomicrobiota bacterium]